MPGRGTKRKRGDDSHPLRLTGNILGDMTLEKFSLWSRPALETFLRLRNMSTNGTFDSLVSRAYVTWEDHILIDPDKEHVYRQNLSDYKQKLVAVGSLPDPFTLEGWTGENEMTLWPPVYFLDMAEFFRKKTSPDLFHRLCNEYKEGKGYRYFTDSHVKEVHYHAVSAGSPYAYFSAKVQPSMRSIQPYQVWVCVEKSGKNPGGTIHEAYCTCTAGLHGSCNHVAGLLFRVEYFVRTGQTSPTCTSVLSQWKMPGRIIDSSTSFRPLSEFVWKKGHYQSIGTDHDDHQMSVKSLGREFTTLTSTQERYARTPALVDDFATAFQHIASESCFIKMHFQQPFESDKEPSLCPPPPIDIGKAVEITHPITPESLQSAREQFVVTKIQCAAIERCTRHQSKSLMWQQQRKGRITASRMKRVYTRTLSLLKDSTQGPPRPVIQEIMGYMNTPTTIAMKHGLSLENHAKIMYTKIMKKSHKKFEAKDSGLVVDPGNYHLAASPDLITSCKCHGQGLCEIKCPYTVRDSTPTHENWPSHLKYNPETKKTTLSTTSPYYFQIQAQMGVLNLDHCDFFVYTAHGHHLERIGFDKDMWENTSIVVRHFWSKYIVEELCTGNHAPVERREVSDHLYVKDPATAPAPDETNARKTTFCKSKPPLSKPCLPHVYLCGTCNLDIEEEPEQIKYQSVLCSGCTRWFHITCVNIVDQDMKSLPSDWYCDGCNKY